MKLRSLFYKVFVTLMVFALLAACAPKAVEEPVVQEPVVAEPAQEAAPVEKPAVEDPTAVPAVVEVKDLVTWFQYDEKNMDPKAGEAVGNEYLRNAIPVFNEEFAGKYNWVNQPKAFDKMEAELINLVQAGGDVPDIYELFNSVNNFYKNGTLQDLTDWAKAQPWFKDLDASAVASCIGPDGKIYCIPLAQRPQVVFVWKDRFPNGYPTTIEDWLVQAEALKAQGYYAITFFGSTDKGGSGVYRGLNTIIKSFGGTYDDGQGSMLLNTPENIAAIEFIREIVAKGYAPESVFAGGYEEEAAYRDSSAGSFPTGLHGWKFQNTLTAPNGTQYHKGTLEDPFDAFEAGDLFLAHFPAAEGHEPGCGTLPEALAIPVGAKNTEGAKDFINWLMTPEQNPQFALSIGGGLAALKTSQSDPILQTTIINQAAEVVAASSCRPWFGSLTRPSEAQPLIMNAIYKVIKEDPTSDIASVLQKAQDEYNANN
jgi:multiple sugar transport system substrate-binding protein